MWTTITTSDQCTPRSIQTFLNQLGPIRFSLLSPYLRTKRRLTSNSTEFYEDERFQIIQKIKKLKLKMKKQIIRSHFTMHCTLSHWPPWNYHPARWSISSTTNWCTKRCSCKNGAWGFWQRQWKRGGLRNSARYLASSKLMNETRSVICGWWMIYVWRHDRRHCRASCDLKCCQRLDAWRAAGMRSHRLRTWSKSVERRVRTLTRGLVLCLTASGIRVAWSGLLPCIQCLSN